MEKIKITIGLVKNKRCFCKSCLDELAALGPPVVHVLGCDLQRRRPEHVGRVAQRFRGGSNNLVRHEGAQFAFALARFT